MVFFQLLSLFVVYVGVGVERSCKPKLDLNHELVVHDIVLLLIPTNIHILKDMYMYVSSLVFLSCFVIYYTKQKRSINSSTSMAVPFVDYSLIIVLRVIIKRYPSIPISFYSLVYWNGHASVLCIVSPILHVNSLFSTYELIVEIGL